MLQRDVGFACAEPAEAQDTQIMKASENNSRWHEDLDRAVKQRSERMRQLRRHMHSHPEVSGDERATSLYLYQLLGDEGFDVRMGPEGRGVVADLPADPDGQLPKIAIRADVDALRIHDAKSVPYRSQTDGVMHACGHDAHSALVFGAISAINELRTEGRLPWEVPLRGIFQPAEETTRGAKEMIAVGALDGVAAILASHMDPMRPLGHVGLRVGVLTASCDEMTVQVIGQGGHAARPHETSDPIAAAAYLISAMYQFIPRATDSQDAVVVTIGQLIGGENANVIPEEVMLRGTVRTLDQRVRQKTFDQIHRLAHGIGEATGTQIQVEFGLGSGSVVNDPLLMQLLRSAARDVVGDDGLDDITRASMGSEDFASYLEQVPGAMVRLGCTSDRVGGSPLHSAMFDIDEQVLEIGAKILARAAILWANPERTTSA